MYLVIGFKNPFFPEKEISAHQFLDFHMKHSFCSCFLSGFMTSRHIIQEYKINYWLWYRFSTTLWISVCEKMKIVLTPGNPCLLHILWKCKQTTSCWLKCILFSKTKYYSEVHLILCSLTVTSSLVLDLNYNFVILQINSWLLIIFLFRSLLDLCFKISLMPLKR